jgi:predicted hydrocarbon binding protein/DNA-binding response OmpR family regulator
MSGDLVYVVHPEAAVAEALRGGLQAAAYDVVNMSSVQEVKKITSDRHFMIPDAILTPLGDIASGDSMLIALFQSNPLMEQIPLVVVASSEGEERRRALRMGLLSVVYPPYDGEEVALTTKLAIDKHRSDQMLFGSLSQLSVPDLLQTAEAGRRSGTITFRHDGRKGTVWMRNGFVVDAEVEGECRGEEAVYAIAIWDTGTFEANFGNIDVTEAFRLPPSSLLLEAMRRFDEESASDIRIPVVEPVDAKVLDVSLVLLNVVSGYSLNHLHPSLVSDRLEKLRLSLLKAHPSLAAFIVTEESAVALVDGAAVGAEDAEMVEAVGTLVSTFFEQMETALAWRFTSRRLARLVAPWRQRLEELGFLEPLGLTSTEAEERDEEIQEAAGVAGKPVPVGCLVLDGDGQVIEFSTFGPRIGRVDPAVVMGRPLAEILPAELSATTVRLMERVMDPSGQYGALSVGREVLRVGHAQHVVRIAVVRPASKVGFVVVINRMRDQRRSLTPDIERDPITGSLRDGRADRLLVINEDFLHGFEDVFARSLSHRHHELLQRFGKKWGLRHAMRLEHMVQRDYRMTLREMESQMALELLSASIGVFGLGRFEADLGFRDQGVVVIHHHASPFPGIFAATAGGACSILSGFHAATLSYLAGRHLAAREVQCAREPGQPCLFVIATEDRLTKLLIATPRSADHALLEEIKGLEGKGEAG